MLGLGLRLGLGLGSGADRLAGHVDAQHRLGLERDAVDLTWLGVEAWLGVGGQGRVGVGIEG